MKRIDLNCDMGELPAAIANGTQEALMPSFTSVNVACGGHAGDEHTMRLTIQQALKWNVAVGAHPGYADRANFGRAELDLTANAVADSVFAQVSALAKIAAECGTQVAHVKPHGALYNQAVRNEALAQAIASGVARWRRDVVLVGLAGSPMLAVFRAAGFAVAAEAFADRRYEPDGALRSRKYEDALIGDPQEAARQALHIVLHGKVFAKDGTHIGVKARTLCIHGDTPGAANIASAVAAALRNGGIRIAPLSAG